MGAGVAIYTGAPPPPRCHNCGAPARWPDDEFQRINCAYCGEEVVRSGRRSIAQPLPPPRPPPTSVPSSGATVLM